MQPVLSVILLAYKHEKVIGECLKAVEQLLEYSEIEVVVAEDFGADTTRAKLQNFIAKYPQVKGIFPERNIGHCAIFNKALALTTGSYVWDLAGDDIPRVEAFNEVIALLKLNITDQTLVVFEVNEFKEALPIESGKLYYGFQRPFPNGPFLKEALKGNSILAAGMFMPCQLLKDIGGYDETLSFEDYDVTLRLAYKTTVRSYPLVVLHKRESSTGSHTLFFSKTDNRHLESTLKILERQPFETIKKEPELLAAYALSARYHYRLSLRTGHKKTAKKYANLLKAVGLYRPYEWIWAVLVKCLGL